MSGYLSAVLLGISLILALLLNLCQACKGKNNVQYFPVKYRNKYMERVVRE